MRRLRARHVLAGVGAAITLLAVAADAAGIGSGTADFGPGQVAVLAAGVAITVAGALGRRAAAVYRTVAILLLNTIAILILVELVAIPLFWLEHPWMVRWSERRQQAYRVRRPELTRFAIEDRRVKLRYSPLETWRVEPFDGELIHVNDQGFREVPGTECQPGSYRIFAFGGSTMWGWGAGDSATIPAYLQRALGSAAPRPVCIVNMGYNGFVSTQELARLIRQFQRGERPDLILFYDGFNEIQAALLNGWAGDHYMVKSFAQKVESEDSQQSLRDGVGSWLLSSYTYRVYWDLFVLPRLPPDLKRKTPDPDRPVDELSREITDIYLNNYRMIRALAHESGTEAFFFWQPVLDPGRKPLTAEERRIWSETSQSWRDLVRVTYDRMRDNASSDRRLYFLADIFEQDAGEIYLDEVHTYARGNAVVAERMSREIVAELGWKRGDLPARRRSTPRAALPGGPPTNGR